MGPFVANTDFRWFDFLARKAVDGRVDEVNFWSPSATRPIRAMTPPEPVFFRLKSPRNVVAGYGFFAFHKVLGLDDAWRYFGWRNGDAHEAGFLARIGGYRGIDLNAAGTLREPLGCTVLREARFLPQDRWLPWGRAEGWARNIVQGRTETDPRRVERLLSLVSDDAALVDVEAEIADRFRLVDVDGRSWREREVAVREGQGTFRVRLLDAYGGQCAITGEHTEPVLDAAHIQRYLGPRSNHVQNGLVLTKEFHTLFDRGLVAVTPDHRIRISPAIRDRWSNGRRYYGFDNQPLAHVPASPASRPSPDALDWHLKNVFVA